MIFLGCQLALSTFFKLAKQDLINQKRFHLALDYPVNLPRTKLCGNAFLLQQLFC